LSGLVENGSLPGALAGTVCQVVRTVRSAVLGGLVEDCPELADQTALVSAVPGGVA